MKNNKKENDMETYSPVTIEVPVSVPVAVPVVETEPVVRCDKKENDNYRFFTEQEVEKYVYDYAVKTYEGDSSRWSKYMTTIVEIDNVLYQLEWTEGLTEMQDNYFESQKAPIVKKVTTVKASVNEEYVPIDFSSNEEKVFEESLKSLLVLLSDGAIKKADSLLIVSELEHMKKIVEQTKDICIEGMKENRIITLKFLEELIKIKNNL